MLLEWHGRDAIAPHVDVSRTVGWFTNFCPLVLNLQYTDDISRHIIETKDHVHGVRKKRMDYGILKYLTRSLNDAGTVDAGIIFNYWGQFSKELASPYFTVSNENMGEVNSPEQLQNHELEFNSWIINGRLQLTAVYNSERFSGEMINALQTEIEQSLAKIAGHCVALPSPVITTTDVLYDALPYTHLQRLLLTYKNEIQDIYPLTPVQEGIFFHCLQQNSTGLYHEQMAFAVAWRNLQADRLQRCFTALISNADALRAVFVQDNGLPPLQVILNRQSPVFEFLDISRYEEKDRLIAQYKEAEREKGFDLRRGPLLRLSVYCLGEDRYEFVWNFHHIIMDGWCVNLLMEEFLELYRANANTNGIGKVRYPFRNYISWLGNRSLAQAQSYWSAYVSGYTTTTGLPVSQSVVQGYKAGRVELTLQEEETRGLQEYAMRYGVTLNTLMQALWGILLSRYNNSRDILFGSVVSGRNAAIEGIEQMIGLFINTIPVRVKYEEGAWLSQLCRQLQQQSMESMQHHHYPLYEIQSMSSLKNKLFDHIIAFENYPLSNCLASLEHQDEGIAVASISIHEQTNYAFNMVIQPQGAQMRVKAIFNANHYAEWLVQEVLAHYLKLVKIVQKGEDVLIKEMKLQERPAIMHMVQPQLAKDITAEVDLWQRFEEVVKLRPDHIGLVKGDDQFSYGEMHQLARKIGTALQRAGVQGGSMVALKIDRSAEMIMSILGILAAGGGYIPIEPQWPYERQCYIMKESKVQTGISTRRMADKLPDNVQWLYVEDLLRDSNAAALREEQRAQGHLAYIMYTSGSTGRPKGIGVSQGSVWRFANNRESVQVKATDAVLQWSNYAFDGSVFDIFSTLLNGGRLVMMAPEETVLVKAVLKKVAQEGINVFFITAAMFHAIVDEGAAALKQLRKVRQILIGGEKLSYQHIKRAVEVLGTGVLVNGYGPTETTVFSTFYVINKPDDVLGSIPIGKPLSYTWIYILEEDGIDLQPAGVWGEICVGGSRLSDGYIGDAEMTARKYIPDPYVTAGRLYRTGDIGRWLPDGNIEYLGRRDNQVKVRGYRIEPGEIEQALMTMHGMQQCHVIARKDTLYVYYKSIQPYTVGLLREHLFDLLPAYMVPSIFIRVNEFPLTENGKLHIAALPMIEEPENEEQIVHAVSETEKRLLGIWQSVLELEKEISVEKNFFETGGHSIKATQLMGRILEQFNVEISFKHIMTHATIRKQAALIEVMVEKMEKIQQILERIENS